MSFQYAMRKAGLSSCWLLVLVVFATCHEEFNKINKLRTVFSWKALDFAFGSDIAREAAIRTGRFKPGAAIPIDVDVHYGNYSDIYALRKRNKIYVGDSFFYIHSHGCLREFYGNFGCFCILRKRETNFAMKIVFFYIAKFFAMCQ